ncbi:MULTISPECIES: PTS sugar transporter subunit IIA [Enterococcus]|uniref:PTS sugar transporter subunit IIA n=1 Tax=Enterococcus TaxID=1350 RepID=UPI0008ADC6B4|nr:MULTISPECIES: PTS sugar transporter subunit IIA [Enterococcus]SES95359.1 PTS system, mannose-specific IIA component [Enterococcus malodoratus]HCM84973.1 PTS mannose/fructose/sorbose family IIA subunit [Enterococcus sp.]
MIGLLVVTHGDLGKSLLESIAIIAGEVKCSASVGLYHGDSPVQLREEIQGKVEALDTGEGVIVLVDFYGGTPGNEVMKLLVTHKMKVLSGVNMAMLLEIVVNREFTEDLEALARTALQSGKESIQDLNEVYNNLIAKAGEEK